MKKRRMMMTIDEIWRLQESDSAFTAGIMLRVFGSGFQSDVYVALISPGNFRCLAAAVDNELAIDVTPYNGLKDLDISIEPHPRDRGRKLLLFKLLNPAHRDIFTVLCTDLFNAVKDVKDERLLVSTLLNRFANWNGLFRKSPGNFLTPEEQRGLWGELYFLRSLLQSRTNLFSKVSAWVGCESQVRDFQWGDTAVEIKTSKGNNHQKIHINGDRQLDETLLKTLYIYHLSLEALQGAGETLVGIVASVKSLLSDDAAALNRFEIKLLLGGYRDEDQEHYSDAGYLVRNDTFYHVEGDFPRIRENELRPGIGDVEYTIAVTACTSYIANQTSVFNNLNLL